MLNSISRLGKTRPEQEWSNGTEFSGYSDFPEKRLHSKRIPKFSKTLPGIFTVPFSFGPKISVFLVEWKAPLELFYKLIAILRRQYHIILTASWEKATEPNTEYIFAQSRQYNVVLPSQNRN